jgi:SAM-dependent methyltransferase
MSYEQFAYLYDELMKDAPYDQWVSYVQNILVKYDVKAGRLLDLACGTGELSVRFAQQGFDVTGIDLSEDMLSVAQAKAEEKGVKIPFFQQNMANLEGQELFDVIGIFCDSLNYLQSEDEVKSTFSNVHQHLQDNGVFIFDVHSLYKMNDVFLNQTFSLNEEEIAYIWTSFPGEYPNSVEHELSFFVLDNPTGKYDRIDELHIQRTYPIEQYITWLEAAGFQILEVGADFEHNQPIEHSERIFFVARKK